MQVSDAQVHPLLTVVLGACACDVDTSDWSPRASRFLRSSVVLHLATRPAEWVRYTPHPDDPGAIDVAEVKGPRLLAWYQQGWCGYSRKKPNDWFL